MLYDVGNDEKSAINFSNRNFPNFLFHSKTLFIFYVSLYLDGKFGSNSMFVAVFLQHGFSFSKFSYVFTLLFSFPF